MAEIFNKHNPPPSLLDSKAGLRGAVLGFVSKNHQVTHQELEKEFGKSRELEEALWGLFDRCQLDFTAGTHKYFCSPPSQWRLPR